MKLQINQNLSTPQGKLLKGSIIEVKNENNIPLDKFWRNRIKDSQIDNCVSIITKSNKK